MKYLIILTLFILSIGCSSNTVFWCGDHQCKNKKEKKEYFKKTMIEEIRDVNKNKKRKMSEFERITELNISEQNKNFKKIEKEKKIIEKKRIKEEKLY